MYGKTVRSWKGSGLLLASNLPRGCDLRQQFPASTKLRPEIGFEAARLNFASGGKWKAWTVADVMADGVASGDTIEEKNEEDAKRCPIETSSIFSVITYSWVETNFAFFYVGFCL